MYSNNNVLNFVYFGKGTSSLEATGAPRRGAGHTLRHWGVALGRVGLVSKSAEGQVSWPWPSTVVIAENSLALFKIYFTKS